ncbi:MAG TPA: gephyrin-like molybdotransferase Glp [Gaiellaceae bacterium]|nr:gephyrin-like molybdotransferase Glp [Gaiellaceae bacterium]
MPGLLTIDEALALVLERARPLPAEEVRVADAAGLVAAEAAPAAIDLPPFDSSAMDGYAVRAGDTPGTLDVVAESAAGRPADRQLAPGEAIRISTGAVVPAGADAVVPVERTSEAGDAVRVEAVAAGANIRPRAGDARAGESVVEAGTVIGPVQVGALAGAGVTTVRCTRRPRVALLATGTELRRAGEPLAPGEIYESNTVMLAAQVRSANGEPLLLGTVADDEAATRAALERGLEADVLLTSGGVSVGEHDLVRALLASLGADEVFWRVAVKPGKPVAFAVREETLVFGLPGNPVSSLVGFELFVRPALAALQGAPAPAPAYLPGRLADPVRRNDARDELVRARVEPGGVLRPVRGQESHMIARAAAANALVLVPRGEGELGVGAEVSWLSL